MCNLRAECGKTIQDSAGVIVSPSYPHSSPPPEGEYCEWRITATHGERIVLNITDLDVYESNDCENSYLEVRDGYWIKSTLLGKFCGYSQLPRLLVSTGYRMLVIYKTSPNQHNHRGFNASYEGLCVCVCVSLVNCHLSNQL